MKKSTKGALAAAAAGTLLLGGAGSLAYWTDLSTITGTDITSGYLDLAAPVCTGGTLHDWQIDPVGAAPAVAYNSATMLLVPGDTLTKKCDITIGKAGTHFTNADFTVAQGATSGSAELFGDELTLTAAYSKGAVSLGSGSGTTTGVAVSNGDTVTVDLTIAWPYGVEDNTSNSPTDGLDAALASISITAKQNHN